MRLIRWSALAIFIAIFVAASGVSADAVGPPPTDCPAGTMGEPSHTGPYCAPALCTTDASCTGGATCRDVSMCIAQQACGGMSDAAAHFPDGGAVPPCTFDTAHGYCEGGAACGTGTCETRRVCVAAPAPASSAGCHCAIGGNGARGAWLLSVLVVVALHRRARRRRS